ncbi:MAG TPA: hypothetical protein VGO00_01560, partial [Kofleriaceae bacterium]|nr:hypothetical protein [Kofleriaceae bacterium]
MTSLTRWKLACAVFAAVAGYGYVFGGGDPPNTPAAVAAAPRGAMPLQLRRSIRVSAESIGVSKQDLIERVLAARTVKEIQQLADKVAAVGDDETIDALRPLVADSRRGVPEVILGAIGKIATEHAVDVAVAAT